MDNLEKSGVDEYWHKLCEMTYSHSYRELKALCSAVPSWEVQTLLLPLQDQENKGMLFVQQKNKKIEKNNGNYGLGL